jgi:hypothetical protein
MRNITVAAEGLFQDNGGAASPLAGKRRWDQTRRCKRRVASSRAFSQQQGLDAVGMNHPLSGRPAEDRKAAIL